jgi:hypothetical protein
MSLRTLPKLSQGWANGISAAARTHGGANTKVNAPTRLRAQTTGPSGILRTIPKSSDLTSNEVTALGLKLKARPFTARKFRLAGVDARRQSARIPSGRRRLRRAVFYGSSATISHRN